MRSIKLKRWQWIGVSAGVAIVGLAFAVFTMLGKVVNPKYAHVQMMLQGPNCYGVNDGQSYGSDRNSPQLPPDQVIREKYGAIIDCAD